MPAGRPPKPTALKLVQGNPGKRALPKAEPKPASGAPKVPSWLNPAAKRIWRGLVPLLEDMRVLTVADGTALALLSDVLAEYAAARAVVEEKGATYETVRILDYLTNADGNEVPLTSSMVRKRPEVEIASDAWRRATTMLGQFGLTPSARVKVQAITEDKADPFDKLFGTG